MWKNSLETIDWFRNIRNKSITFIQFDIIEIYSSISKELLLKTFNHTRNYIGITDEDKDIVLICRKCILIGNKTTWVKSYIDNFGVTM